MKKIIAIFFVLNVVFCFSQTDTTIYTAVEEHAEFPGGISQMSKFIITNIHYPEDAIKAGISGRCLVRFVVNEDSTISNVEVLKNVVGCQACDDEVVRVIKSMPKWKPGKIGGKTVKSYFYLPFSPHFR